MRKSKQLKYQNKPGKSLGIKREYRLWNANNFSILLPHVLHFFVIFFFYLYGTFVASTNF